MNSNLQYTVTFDLSHLELYIIQRKLNNEEISIVMNELTNNIDSYMDECVYENSGVKSLIKLWAQIDKVIKRPLTKEEHKIILKEYYKSQLNYNEKNIILKNIVDLVSSWNK